MRKQKSIQRLPLIVAFIVLVATFSNVVPLGRADAAAFSLSAVNVRLNRVAYSAATGGRVCAKTNASQSGTEAKVAVTFPTNAVTDYQLNTVTMSAWAATGVADASQSALAWPGLSSTSATSASGHTVVWASSDLAANTMYCFTFAGGLTNANNNTENVPGDVTTQDAGSATLDKGYFALGLANPAVTGDQVSISGVVVPPIFTFVLNGNTDSFSQNLSLTTPRFSAGNTPGTRTITVSTNASNGYVVWAKSANDPGSGTGNGRGSLKSLVSNYYLYPAAAVGTAARTMSAGTQDYGLGVFMGTNGSGVTPNSTFYGGAGRTQIGTLDATGFQPIVSATAPTASDVINVYEGASMSTATESGSDYADTITFVGSGLF